METSNTPVVGRDPDSVELVDAPEQEEQVELVLFEIGSTLLALETAHVLNVAPATTPVPVPTAPPAFLGIAVIHGRIYAVADIGPLLHLSGGDSTSDTDGRFLVIQTAKHQMALLVDRVVGLAELPESSMQRLQNDNSNGLRDELKSAYAETGHGPAAVIDIERIAARLRASSSNDGAS